MVKQNNLFEFISFEHNNQLVSLANLKSEFGFLQELDEIYQETKNAFSINENNNVQFLVGVMYLQAHGEFYVGMSQFFRSHLSKSFLSLRIAIDAAFNACYFIENPSHTEEFIDEESPLQQKIFKRMKQHIKDDPQRYPLAQTLVPIHELASKYSAHSSVSSLAFKYRHVKDADQKEEIMLNYFDGLEPCNFFPYYFSLLKGHFMVFQLFYNGFFKKEFRIIYQEREKRIADFEVKINQKHKQYPLSSQKEDKSLK